ncbi:MAG: hypothetical protein AB7V46_17390, partial [Thermomicrobiales bacterium]
MARISIAGCLSLFDFLKIYRWACCEFRVHQNGDCTIFVRERENEVPIATLQGMLASTSACSDCNFSIIA